MDSALQSEVASIQMKDYATLVILTVVGYDYVLTFADEIEYVWNKSWSWVSTLFLLTRYFGLCNAIIFASGKTFGIFDTWASFMFVGAAQMIMILRVWALYRQSMVILVALLTPYIIEFILYFVIAVIFSMEVVRTETSIQVLGVSFCQVDDNAFVWSEVMNYVQLALGVLMCVLIATEFVKQSFQMYKVVKQFQVSSYINLLTREGVIYFVFVVTCAAIALAESIELPVSVGGWIITLLDMIEYIPTITLVPRFVITLRKLYADTYRGCHGGEIDTAFGLASTSGCGAAPSAILFKDPEHTAKLEEDDDIQMEEICSTIGNGA